MGRVHSAGPRLGVIFSVHQNCSCRLSAFTLVTIRVGLGALGLWTIIGLTGQALPRDRATLLGLLIVGTFNTAVPFVLITWGEQFIDSGVAGILNGTVPLFTLVVAHYALADERISWARFGGLMIGFVGLLLIFSDDLRAVFVQSNGGGGLGAALGNLQGQLAVVLASISYSVAAVFIRRRLGHVRPLMIAGGGLLTAFVLVGSSALIIEQPFASQPGGQAWFAVGWLGLMGASLAYILYYYIIREWGATRASLVTYVMPIMAVILGAIVLSELLTWQVFAGGALILGGIVLVNRKTSQSVAASKPAAEATA